MSKIYTGEIRGGVVVFEGTPPSLPEGTKVRVEPVEIETALADLSDRLLKLSGTVEGLPEDYAENLDHYLRGQPKR